MLNFMYLTSRGARKVKMSPMGRKSGPRSIFYLFLGFENELEESVISCPPLAPTFRPASAQLLWVGASLSSFFFPPCFAPGG